MEKKKNRRGLRRLKDWKRIHMLDPDYRKELARKQRERMETLRRDAEFGRVARIMLLHLGSMLFNVGKSEDEEPKKFRHKSEQEVLMGMKRPFSPEEARRYMELLRVKDRIEARRKAR